MSAVIESPVLSVNRPFPGLRPYATADHPFFFGRDDQTFALYRLLDRSRFIAIVGSSGSGKSSLVRAGLLPLLEEETRGAGGRNWHGLQMQPGDSPLAALAAALAGQPPVTDDGVARAVHAARRERIGLALSRSSFGMDEALAMLELPPERAVYLLVDQFEELFRFAAAARSGSHDWHDRERRREEAARFVQLLLQASRNAERPVHVLITLRSDFIGDCARFQGLPEAICAAQFLVPNLTRDQREEVIRGPVEAAGAEISCELVERLLNDGSEDMDQLPVLQHCLMRVWETAGRQPGDAGVPGRAGTPVSRTITLDHYRAVGELKGALSRHANALLDELRDHEQAVAAVFRALCDLDREGRAVRRALSFARIVLESGLEEAEVRCVIDRFRSDDCSFLVPSASAVAVLQGNSRVDVGHEALLRNWEKITSTPTVCLDAQPTGWIWDEDRDRRSYQALLALVDTAEAPERVTLPLEQIESRWNWWNQRPRTEAWTERYGGGRARVARLLQASMDRFARHRRNRTMLSGGKISVGLAGAAALLFWGQQSANDWSQRQQQRAEIYREKLVDLSAPGGAGSGNSDGQENARPREGIGNLWKVQTAVSGGSVKESSLLAGSQGYMWIGNAHNSQLQATPDPASSIDPSLVMVDREYIVSDDTYLREALPDPDYRSQKIIGVIPQGTRVRALDARTPIPRPRATQYWLKVLVLD